MVAAPPLIIAVSFNFPGTKAQGRASSLMGSTWTNEENDMRKFTIALLTGAGALFAGSANAADIYTTSEYTNSDLPVVQPVRLVCDEDGRCYRTRGGSRVIVRDSYDYAPRERYIERRSYHDWDDSPRAGVGFRAPGVSVGVGVGGDRW
jgi:hypothetical protein